MEKQYSSEVSILPSASSSSQNFAGKLGSIASLAGVNLGGFSTRSPEMYQGILTSRRLLEELIYYNYSYTDEEKSFQGNLIEFFEIEGKTQEVKVQKVLKQLRDYIFHTSINPDNQILYITVTVKNPQVSAQIANRSVEILENIVLDKLQIEFKEQNEYLTNRIILVNDSLKILEENLQSFLEKYSDPTLPSFQVEQLRLRRDIEIYSAILIELQKQQEILMVQNFINLSPIKILDKAYPPYRKSRPKRLFVLITLVLLFGFLQVGMNGSIFLYQKYKRNILPVLKS
jgi:uncharacterized protein involved in exopolysaccharide biosynthesis